MNGRDNYSLKAKPQKKQKTKHKQKKNHLRMDEWFREVEHTEIRLEMCFYRT